jgi:hypothetical protein
LAGFIEGSLDLQTNDICLARLTRGIGEEFVKGKICAKLAWVGSVKSRLTGKALGARVNKAQIAKIYSVLVRPNNELDA